MFEHELLLSIMSGYTLGYSICQKGLWRGGMCILVNRDQHFGKIDNSHQDFEI
jgi:hypothetical protein